MRCVSYTRTTSCKEDGKIPADIIKRQDQHIQEYLKKQGWTLSAKYCDRKKDTEENAAFEELTKDGIDRKFDMVVVDSIDRCGRTISCADDVLVKTFVPAGIHFAVVQDEFISIGKTKEELYEYIKKARYEAVQLKGMREYAVREQLEGLYTVHDEKYGYILSDDRRELLIDEEAAVVVREIFQMVLDGMLIANIVKILNDSGIESPMVHNARVGHKVWPAYDNKWLFCSVKRILRCTAYAGYWQKTINKKICTLPIAPILEEGIFEKVQEILDKRKKPRKTRPGKNGLFVKKIFDAETGRKISQRNFRTGETVFLFASGTNQLPRDKSTYISFETVIAEVRKVIQREMELAEQIKKKLSAREAESEKYKWLKQYSQRAWTIFEEMEQVEKERIPLYQNYQTGKINEEEYLEGKEEIRDQLCMYDGDFSELMEEVSVIEKAYSNKNEWLETFKKENLPKELQPEHINKWIEEVLIRDFKEVQVCLSKQEWKKYFPAEWMEE